LPVDERRWFDGGGKGVKKDVVGIVGILDSHHTIYHQSLL
jgi:hypothetical protein